VRCAVSDNPRDLVPKRDVPNEDTRIGKEEAADRGGLALVLKVLS